MEHLSVQNIADSVPSLTKTVFHFNDQITLTIDWTIPYFSTLRARTTCLESDVIVVGVSSWKVLCYPLCTHARTDQSGDAVEATSTSVYLVHNFVRSDCNLLPVKTTFKISVLKDDSETTARVSLVKASKKEFTAADNSGGFCSLFKHADIWGPNATLVLEDDILRLRVEIEYLPSKLSTRDRMPPGEPLRKKLRGLMVAEVGKDYTLVSAEGHHRKVHRAVINNSSPFFSAMFQSGMKDSKAKRHVMPDVSTCTLDALIRYMYYQGTDKLKECAKDVLVAADKYLLGDLKEACEHILAEGITNETAIDLLILADKVSAPILKDAALRYAGKNLRALQSAGEMKKLMDDNNKMDGRLTEEIFAAVARWGTK